MPHLIGPGADGGPRTGPHVLVCRLDSMGDVLLAGPAVRAVAWGAARVTMLVSSLGAPAAALLPGVDAVLTFDAPWVLADPPPFDRAAIDDLVVRVAGLGVDLAIVLTSFHQSPLPLALVLRLAGVPTIAATCDDYPGALLDVRHRIEERPDGSPHEVERARSLVAACGFASPSDEPHGERLAITVGRGPQVAGTEDVVVVHGGSAAPARGLSPDLYRSVVSMLVDAGRTVVLTGAASERRAAAEARVPDAVDVTGALDLAATAAVLADASVVVAGNTGIAHLAAAVGTPVVSVFAPTVPWARWRPWGVPTVRLGDQGVPCAGCRARRCPLPVQSCLAEVTPSAVLDAVVHLTSGRFRLRATA